LKPLKLAGEVVDVPVQPNTPLKQGDVLFRIDPIPFEALVKALEAQLMLSAKRLSQMTELVEKAAGRQFDVEQRQAEVDQLKAQIESAKWNLDKTTVRAPSDKSRPSKGGACCLPSTLTRYGLY
jgi:multidrug resistance efflux pump